MESGSCGERRERSRARRYRPVAVESERAKIERASEGARTSARRAPDGRGLLSTRFGSSLLWLANVAVFSGLPVLGFVRLGPPLRNTLPFVLYFSGCGGGGPRHATEGPRGGVPSRGQPQTAWCGVVQQQRFRRRCDGRRALDAETMPDDETAGAAHGGKKRNLQPANVSSILTEQEV